MKKKALSKCKVTSLAFCFCFMVICSTKSEAKSSLRQPHAFTNNSYSHCYNENACGCHDATDPYVFSHHDYETPHYGSYHTARRGYRGFYSEDYLRGRYPQANPFSAGISSYQGTSTGPGPNSGYAGTPRGVYKTHYYPN